MTKKKQMLPADRHKMELVSSSSAPPKTERRWSGNNRVDILGVSIHCVKMSEILDLVNDWVGMGVGRTILYVNAHCLNLATRDPVYRTILNKADLVYADGIGVVWGSRLLGACEVQKATGADWIQQFCSLAEANSWRIYILAGKPGVAESASLNLIKRYPTLNIVGANDGFFLDKSECGVLQEIAQTAPQILFVGMGTSRQEKWIAAHRDEIPAVCWAVGALFDYIAGVEPRAPAWMRILALEWCWRLLVDPVGKWRRYVFGIPLFVYRVLRQKWDSKGSSTS